jgi:hypothetical protein
VGDYNKSIVSIRKARRREMESEEYMNRKQQEAKIMLVYSLASF